MEGVGGSGSVKHFSGGKMKKFKRIALLALAIASLLCAGCKSTKVEDKPGQGTESTKDGSGKNASGKDGSGKDGSGKDGSGKNGSGKDGSGKDGSGKNGSGKNGSGADGSGLSSEDIDSLLGKVRNSRQNALDSGADDVLSKAFKAAEAEYERLRKLAEQGDNSAELAERLKNLSDFYEGLSAFSEAKKKKERIDDGGYADHGRKAYDHGSSLLDELSNIDDFDARLAADAEAFAAGGKAATSGFGSEFLKKAKQADSDFSAVFKAAANNERSDALKAKKQADSVKASVSRKTDYDTGVNYFRTGDTNYVTGSIEASILNYVDAKEMFAKLYSEISKLRAAAQKHIDAAKKRVSSSDAKAGEADRTDPLTEKIVGIEDPDAKLLEDDDFTEAANSYVELDEELSAGGSL